MTSDLGRHSRNGLGALPSLVLPADGLVAAGEGSPPGPGLSEAARAGDEPLGGWPKRLVDLAFAILGLVLAAPVMLLVAILIKLVDRGPVFFAHPRVGFRGRSFRCYKFRTMGVDAEARLARHLARDPEAAREWRETQKLRRDPRVGVLGGLLRQTSLDELPQLFNILRGDMSCVGPRPVTQEELARYGARVDCYLRARPGLTGAWQVAGRSSAGYETRVQLDAEYVHGWSLWADLGILCRTPMAVARLGEAC
jgi:exopolysaccharide production protein ExoY